MKFKKNGKKLFEAVKLTLALGLSSTFPHVLIIWHRHSRSSAKSAIGRRRRFSNNWGVQNYENIKIFSAASVFNTWLFTFSAAMGNKISNPMNLVNDQGIKNM